MEFRFTTEHRRSDIGSIINFLARPRLWIPSTDYDGHHHEWLGKAYEELRSGVKQAITADFDGYRVAAIIFQAHKQLGSDYLEMKNMTLDPRMRGRHVAEFLVVNAEFHAARIFGSKHVIADAKASNKHVRRLLLALGYKIIGVSDLYTWGKPDITYAKKIRHRKDTALWMPH